MATLIAKRVLDIHSAQEPKWVGDGFPVRNVVSYNRIAHEISPFLQVDLIGPHDFERTGERLGSEEMPYKGMELVTLMYDGEIEHIDSRGNFGTVGAGDVQWATAGSGIVYEEKHSEGFCDSAGRLSMVRIWVNLPKVHKLFPPRYQLFKFGGLPRVDLPADAGYMFVVAGEVAGEQAPVETRSPIVILDMRLKEGGEIELPFPPEWSVMVLVTDGKLGVENGQSIDTGQLARFDQLGAAVEIQAFQNTSAVLMAGLPIIEPVTAEGGIVMNTPDEVLSAVQDYQSGRMGKVSQEDQTGLED